VEIRSIDTLDELERMAELERAIWGMPTVPTHQTLTVAKNGGVVLGAYEAEELIGFLYSFPGLADGEVYLCSHMLGVQDGHRNKGIGHLLKLAQADAARALGYRRIRWTYDPLQSRNAYLNIAKLGAICSEYIVNCYGEMTDGLNQGLPSDRFNVDWYLDRPTVPPIEAVTPLVEWEVRADGLPHVVGVQLGAVQTEVVQSEAVQSEAMQTGAVQSEALQTSAVPAQALSVAIPAAFAERKADDPGWAMEWRLRTREALVAAFAAGWAVVDIRRTTDGAVQEYRLVKRAHLRFKEGHRA